MVERKIRPAPLTLVTRRSVKSSAAKSGPAARLVPASKLFVLDTNVLMHDPTSLFRFEEHDIYLPDPHARGARQQQERRHRSRAQRAAGVALPGRARHRDARRNRRRHPAHGEVRRRRHRPAVPADRGDHDRAARLARQRQGGQPDPRRRHAPAASAHEAQRHPGVEGHQHADQGARARDRRRGLLQRQGARGHRAPLQRDARAAGRISGTGTARGWNRGSRAATRTTGSRDRSCRRSSSTSSSTTRSPASSRSTSWSRRSRGAPRCCRRSRTTRTRRTTSGASRRAIASRTSRSTCS